MASANDEQARKLRLNRLRPFLKDLSAEKEPRTDRGALLLLTQDLKDEGNELFKEKQFDKAASHYKHALFVTRVLEDRFYHAVEDDFLTTLYLNGSLALLKLSKFTEALDFAESAQGLQPNNPKARYRKALALEGLHRTREALAEAKEGLKEQPAVFKSLVAKLEANQEPKRQGIGKSVTASATESVPSVQSSDTSNEWLAGTNALKTEKQRQAVLEKMPKKKKNKKKAKAPQPVVHVSSQSESDSDSSDASVEDSPESSASNTDQKSQAKGNSAAKGKAKVVKVKASESPNPDSDVLAQRTGFTEVGALPKKPNGMGLDTFGTDDSGFTVVKSKNHAQGVNASKQQNATASKSQSGQKLPPVDINWPLEEAFQFRRSCKYCFIKFGEGYKGFKYDPHLTHTCEKNVLIIRRKENESLNWIKIRPFPELMNNHFNEFKMCQQFSNSQPCKIGEARCTFPHSKHEMNLWYMEVEGEFCYSEFMEALNRHNITTSEELAARRPAKSAAQHIPGLNYKTGARQRLSSPAPLAEPSAPVVNKGSSHPSVEGSSSDPPSAAGTPPPYVSAAPASSALLPNKLVKASLLGAPPLLPSPQPPPPMMFSASTAPPPTACTDVNSILKDFDINIVCPFCFIYENYPGRYRYTPNTHNCEENVLAVRPKGVLGAPWVRVRERKNHRDFSGEYVMCHSIRSNNVELCRYGEMKCSFAHNEAEQKFWALEKMGKISIADCILQNRKAMSARSFTLHELLKKHGGNFTFVCRLCFYGQPPRISRRTPFNTCTGVVRHQWDRSCIMAHISSTAGGVTLIEPRKLVNKGSYFRICKFLQYCPGIVTGQCLSAHSVVERDVWMVERDSDISREQIVQISQGKPLERQLLGGATSQTSAAQGAGGPSAPQSAGSEADSSANKREKVPYLVREFCGQCWSNGTRSLEDGATNRCVKGHNNFNIKRVFLIVGIYKELRNLPAVQPRNLNFVMCRYIQQKKKCQYPESQGVCQFAHSEEERVLWIWMARHKVLRLEEVVKYCIEDTKPARINQGDSVVTATATSVRDPMQMRVVPATNQNAAHYCKYCSVQSNSRQQWEQHCASDKHIFNVNSDKDHQWNFRQPPWGQGNNLSLCARHVNGNCCPYSSTADMFNLCVYAHSQEELDEWIERYEWRQMKRALAKEQKMFSYMEQLLERYNSADSRVNEISETLAGVHVECAEPLVEYRQEKNATLHWTFVLQSQMTLERVALLHHSARLHFCLQAMDGSKGHQIMGGEHYEVKDMCGSSYYKVTVYFTGGMFGSYSQWVIFDFGKKPVLLRKLNVELGHKSVQDKVKDLRQQLTFNRWTGDNRQVIPYQYSYDSFSQSLLQRYKEPSAEAVVTQDSVRELNQHNYVHKMHRLLDLEEITRHKLISRFNMVIDAEVQSDVNVELRNMHHNRRAELFLRLPLTDNLTEDTGAGRLILTNVNKVLLTRNDAADKQRVYEALIEGKGKDYVIVSLSPVCVRELQLRAGMVVQVEVQFQINRMHFINMHHALDCLESTDIVFPDISKINPRVNEEHHLKVSSKTLNKDQLQAVRHIVAERTGYTPPFVMYGPFGTGKTETLAQAAMVLLRERHDARILICAQSNSAADLYITKHLDPYLRRGPGNSPLLLRIVSKDRRVTSIPEGSRKYCFYSSDNSSFEIPSANQVAQFRIVVTTVEMSLRLTNMKLKGAFTHIFIDEAAQALECETIMPLTLATDKTCVVMTGDHLQISPKVYSAEARRQSFDVSMLERLYNYYSNYRQQLQSVSASNPLNIFLSINYRTKMEVLRFISAVFYGGPNKLTAGGNIPSVVELTPLQFYAVLGREEQPSNSTSYVNLAECSEVVERVISLLDDWPREWGRIAPEEIGVLTPYYDQVKQIRYMLKEYHRSDLRSVSVEPVQNIQGKEFRALFISTVRTRHILNSEHVAKALREAESMGGVTDFAFLSDLKLLNTAMTRTKSMVAVIGDPLALCAIGECITIWRTYLKHCNNMRSIRPPDMNYDSIKSQVVEMQMSPMGRRLLEVTKMCKNPPISPPASPPPTADRYMVSGAGDTGQQRQVYIDDVEPSFGVGDAAAASASRSMSSRSSASPLSTYSAPLAAAVPAFSAPSHMPGVPLTSYTAPPAGVPYSAPPSVSASVPYSAPPYSVPPPAAAGVPYSAPPPPSAVPVANYSAPPPSVPVANYSAPPPSVPVANYSAPPPSVPVANYNAPPPSVPVTNYSAPPPSVPALSLNAPPPPLRGPMMNPASGLHAPAPLKPVPLKPLSKLKLSKPAVEEFKSSDFPIKADEILVQLAMETLQDAPLPLKVECIQVSLEEGQAIVSYNQQLQNEERRRKLLQAAAAGMEFECDAEIYADEDEATGKVTKYYNYTEQTLLAALHGDRKQFKRCIVHVKEDSCVAEVVDPSDSLQEIEISGLLHRGRAFDQDEAVVQILSEQGETGAAQGQVVGILQRAVDHRYRTFVCYADAANTSLFTPLTPGIPCVYNVTQKKHSQQVKNGNVCVYNLSADNTLTFSHYEKVEASNSSRKLFVVRYLKWLPGFFHPVGVVVGVVPEGSNVQAAQKIVDIEHNVPVDFSGQVVEEVTSDYSNNTLPAEVYNSRMNLTQTWSFTIDFTNTSDLQVAFSVEQASDISYQVCVHVADVASFIRMGSAMDKEAAERGSSLQRCGGGQVPMLPSRLSGELCSLKPGQDRCALSVFMMVSGSGEQWHVTETSLHQTVINSKQHFSFQDVDSILEDVAGAEHDYLKSCILVLYQIASMQRRIRKGNECLDSELDPVEMMAPQGHQMVQEVLMMANHHVAALLLKAMPQCVPLVQQKRPSMQQLEVWKSKYAVDAINSLALSKPFQEGNKVCTCTMVCMCVFGYIRGHEVKPRDHFDIVTEKWREMEGAALAGLPHLIQKGVTNRLAHPQALVAKQELLHILPPERWICSGDVDPLYQGHYSLNLPCLTNLTSPLRSYVSIVVQRLISAMIAEQPSPYSQEDIAGLMAVCNSSQRRAESFAAADERVQVAAALQSRPLTLFPAVEKVDENRLRLCFPSMKCLAQQDCDLTLTVFRPSASPQPDDSTVTLTMERRIYDPEAAMRGPSAGVQKGGRLCTDRFISYIPPFQWQQLLAAVREDSEEKQLMAVQVLKGQVHEASSDSQYIGDVSSEVGSGGLLQHFSEFSLSFASSVMVQAQLSAQTVRGMLTPQLQLLSLTPTLDICVEHHRNPSACFAKPVPSTSVANSYKDESHYQQCLMPILALEAAEAAVCSGESAVVHNVTIRWTKDMLVAYTGGQAGGVSGHFSLSQSFCRERHIFPESHAYTELTQFGLKTSVPVPMDLLCVRYKGVEMTDSTGKGARVSAMMKMGPSGSWVGHCMVEEVKHDTQGMVNVHCHLLSSSVTIPPQLLDFAKASQLTCTVELIPKTAAFRQMDYSLACLTSAPRLARDIAVGRRPVDTIDKSDVTFLMSKVSDQLNLEQQKAVQVALQEPFTMIEGPPGCGKTWTGVQLACLFVQRNHMTTRPVATADNVQPQVLMCAASEDALDAVAAHLRLQGSACPRVVRVYDKRTEQHQFPVPRGTIPPSKQRPSSSRGGGVDLEQQAIGLHHLIRSASSKYQQSIQKYDDMFSQFHALVDSYPHSFSDEQIEEYGQLVQQAEVEELGRADIILATCSTVASLRMARGANIKQIIMDSSESCCEVESLLPIILSHRAEQVVMLGDQQQLTPPVVNETARTLGLGRSLLQRYSFMAVRLSKHYRLPQGITDIVSELFYSGGLNPSELDAGTTPQPLVFYHVEGQEKPCTAATDAGVVESFSNMEEAESVVYIVEDLVQKGVSTSQLAVLTQYAAQVQLIQHILNSRQLNSVAVRTVVESQGCEFDYVVLSTCRAQGGSKMPRGAATSGWMQKHLGETADVHQMNVALTRASKMLAIIGNKHLLQCHPEWGRLLDHCRQQKVLMS